MSELARHRVPSQRTPPFVVYVSTIRAYEFSGKSALRIIELEIPMSPVKASSSSKTRKIAPATDSAHTNSEIVTTMFARANRVALSKIALSQNTIITRKGVGTAGLRKQLQSHLRAFRESRNSARLQGTLRIVVRR